MRIRFWKIFLLPSISFALCFSAPIASAQTGSSGVIEEIVVTARKRDERLLDVPVSMTAFTSEEIASAGIENPRDFVALTPNVTLVETQNVGTSFLTIRGVSQARNSEMSAAVLVDGVLMPHPAQFTQQLYDIQQIEVLRGPQGALYGRNAIGGAITVVTKPPGDEFEGRIELGADSGPGYSVRGMVSGPFGNSETLKYRAAISYFDTDGYINNAFRGEEADPFEELAARLTLLYEPSDRFSADFRVSTSLVDTQSLYFVIAAEADDTSLPVEANNDGVNERNIFNASLRLAWTGDAGTFTSITAYDDLDELLTGDQYDFLPRPRSWLNGPFTGGFGDFIRFLTGDATVDLSQTQYLESDALSQEFRFVSPADRDFRWIAGAYFISTDRYISTGNQIDRGNGVFDVKKVPRASVFVDGMTDPSPQLGLLVDAQDNFAWAVFAEVAYDFSDNFEASVSLRYDEDERENTTLTEPLYDPTFGLTTFGEVRKNTWDSLQPKVTLRYKPSDAHTIWGGYSRGFRSGGFNQSGVGVAVPEPGVEDLFEEQIADTYEVGLKSIFGGGRFSTSISAYFTDFENAYFFFFDPNTSTQNLGNIPEVEYTGLELEASAQFNDYFSGYFGLGLTDSDIKRAADPADNGNNAPLVSDYTLNVGAQLRYPMNLFGGDAYGVFRIDYQQIGDTWWEPGNISKRSDVNLVDARLGIEVEDNWSLILWGKNVFDEEYNSEFSPGPAPGSHFLWKAPPARGGLTFTKHF
ncbi:MAG: TonB-dependent receptor [Woeseiaceae bacterium]|nr:TonB-dependent receptor [Woeseiaceae bacterium]